MYTIFPKSEMILSESRYETVLMNNLKCIKIHSINNLDVVYNYVADCKPLFVYYPITYNKISSIDSNLGFYYLALTINSWAGGEYYDYKRTAQNIGIITLHDCEKFYEIFQQLEKIADFNFTDNEFITKFMEYHSKSQSKLHFILCLRKHVKKKVLENIIKKYEERSKKLLNKYNNNLSKIPKDGDRVIRNLIKDFTQELNNQEIKDFPIKAFKLPTFNDIYFKNKAKIFMKSNNISLLKNLNIDSFTEFCILNYFNMHYKIKYI